MNNRRRQVGAAFAETLIVLQVFILMGGGAIQMGLLYQAKSNLNYATFLAARAGSLHGANIDSIENGLRAGLVPMQSPFLTPAGSTRGKLTESTDSLWWGAAKNQLIDDVNDNTEIKILNPTREAFSTYGSGDACPNTTEYSSASSCIPVDNMLGRPESYNQNDIKRATLLRVKVQYGVPMQVPVISSMIRKTMELAGGLTPFEVQMLSQNRLPMESVALVRMQTPPQLSSAVVTNSELSASF